MTTATFAPEASKDRLRSIYVAALKLNISPDEIGDRNLIHALSIDSITSLEILVWIEDEFKITIHDSDLSPALLDSLDTLADYIRRRQQEA